MKTLYGIIIAMLAVMLLAVPVMANEAGTTLAATVDVTPHWTITYGWTIDKSVSPDTLDMWCGDSGTSSYTITITKDAGTEEAWVDGQVCVTNGGAVATENLLINAVLQDGYAPPNDFLTSAPVDVSGNPVLDPGETGCYDYRVNIPITDGAFPQPHAGGTYKVTADVTITNHSGHLGTPFGPSPSATTVFVASPTLVNNAINVDDTNGGSWEFSASGSANYDKTFTCCADEGEHDNTATIRETEQSDDASVLVNCYDLQTGGQLTKDADTAFDRTYYWDITKSADKSSLTLAINQQYLVNYGVTVNLDQTTPSTDSNWAVAGNIYLVNNAPIPVTINSVSDEISGPITATVDCGSVTFPYTVSAKGTLTCSYGANLPDATDRTNTATVTIQNIPSGTMDFTATADVKFAEATMTEIDECIDVSDSFAGSLGTVCYGVDTLPKIFTYSRYIGPYTTCGDYTVDNTASFVTYDTGATGSSSWTVNVHVPCNGCSLTIGYWKTHAGFGPQADMVTALLPQYLGIVGHQTVNTNSLAVQYLTFSGSNNVFDASNGINKLYAQLLGTKLNIANGADGSAVASTISASDSFLATRYSTSWSSLSKAQKNQVIAWATTLDNYNNGLIGPGHCDQ